MDFQFDHDYHIHSYISPCSRDKEQTSENILKKAKLAGLKQVCLTNHLWAAENHDPNHPTSFANVRKALPLPKDDQVDFLFGCEVDISWDGILGITKDIYSAFDFIIVSTTHFHMLTFTVLEDQVSTDEKRAKLWVERFEKLLSFDLPFNKVGIPHLTTTISNDTESALNVIRLIKEEDAERLFSRAAELGCGIEINYSDVQFAKHDVETVLRLFRIAKRCGCKFYVGSDEHIYNKLDYDRMRTDVERFVKLLDLKEQDKYRIPKRDE